MALFFIIIMNWCVGKEDHHNLSSIYTGDNFITRPFSFLAGKTEGKHIIQDAYS